MTFFNKKLLTKCIGVTFAASVFSLSAGAMQSGQGGDERWQQVPCLNPVPDSWNCVDLGGSRVTIEDHCDETITTVTETQSYLKTHDWVEGKEDSVPGPVNKKPPLGKIQGEWVPVPTQKGSCQTQQLVGKAVDQLDQGTTITRTICDHHDRVTVTTQTTTSKKECNVYGKKHEEKILPKPTCDQNQAPCSKQGNLPKGGGK